MSDIGTQITYKRVHVAHFAALSSFADSRQNDGAPMPAGDCPPMSIARGSEAVMSVFVYIDTTTATTRVGWAGRGDL